MIHFLEKIANLKSPRGFILVGLTSIFILGSCAEPPPKYVEPLDPSKVVKEDKPVEKKTPAPPTTGKVTSIPLGDLYQLVQKNAALIYDVRPKFFYSLGHVPGAISFPKGDFDRDIAKHEANIRSANANNTPVVVYCTDLACPDAMIVCTKLVARGHTVALLQGGYEAWKVAVE